MAVSVTGSPESSLLLTTGIALPEGMTYSCRVRNGDGEVESITAERFHEIFGRWPHAAEIFGLCAKKEERH